MVHKMKVAIMGRGLVAQTLEEYLQKDESIEEIAIYASTSSKLTINDREYLVNPYQEINKTHYDVIFGATDKDTVQKWFNSLNTDIFIDNSELFRLNPSIPLVVGRTNERIMTKETRIVANPNCVSSMLARVLYPLHRRYGLSKVITVTYQSVSGLGLKALDAFEKERDDEIYLDGKIMERFAIGKDHISLYDNIVPFVGEEVDGVTHEENKIDQELTKIIGPDVEFSTMCARVPVRIGHSAYVHITFKDRVDITRIASFIENLATVNHVEHVNSRAVKGSDSVHIGRIKGDRNCPFALMLFMTSDNLRVGSGLNSYELYRRYLGMKNDVL